MFVRSLLWIVLLLLLPFSGWADSGRPALEISYAPDVVGVDRLFMVAVKGGTGCTSISALIPNGIVLVDRTKFPDSEGRYRFYFRSIEPSQRTEIRFRGCGMEICVPLTFWSFDDLRTFRYLKGIQLPRRWPLGKVLPEIKQVQTVTSEAEIKAIKGKVGPAAVWLGRSDDDIWAMQPDSTIPRWHWVNLPSGCPIHGKEIYRHAAYQPWIVDLSWPWNWKIKCPTGGETYPSNDFTNGDMTSGKFPDDGIGGGCLHNGKRYGFIAQIAQAYVYQMLRVAPECAQAFIATGDMRYAHKALVALCRIAVEYAYLATMTQHRHRNSVNQVERFGPGPYKEGPFLRTSGLTAYGIDQPKFQWLHAEAYDRIFPAIEHDFEIIAFLQKKGFKVSTPEDVGRFIEENLFATWMQATMDGSFQSNEPHDQRGFARMAEVLNYRTGIDFMEWLYDGEGRMRILLTNAFFRDGSPYEATGGYNGMHISALGPLLDSIEHLRSLRPEIYPELRYPVLNRSLRYRNTFDFDMDTVTIDRSYPSVGDDNRYQGYAAYKKLPLVSWQSGGVDAFERAYRSFLEPKFAWALVHNPGWKPSVNFPFSRESVEAEASRWPDDWNQTSTLQDGYGIAILRGGIGDSKRAFWVYYGHTRQHGHNDIMDIGLQGYEGILLTHLGYPRNWGAWESSWMTHHVARQIPFQTMTGEAHLLIDAGPIHVAEVRAQAFVDNVDSGKGYELPEDSWQRRLLALVDVDADHFYAVDWYRLSGGNEHWWSFYAQEGDFTTSRNLSFIDQNRGTLAGPDVPYGDPSWLKAHGCSLNAYGWSGPMFGFAHLYNVLHAKPEGPFFADWTLKGTDNLHLRLNVITPGGMELDICDGKSPAGGSPYEMKWLLLSKKGGEQIKSEILSVVEPYLRQPLIRGIESVDFSGEKKNGLQASGCLVHIGHRTDTILMSTDSTSELHTADGTRFAGRFGFYSVEEGSPKAIVLIAGTLLAIDGFEIRLQSPEYRGRITGVNRAANKIIITPSPSDPKSMVANYIFIISPNRRSAYKVLAAKPIPGGSAELELNWDARIGTGCASGSENFRVRTSTSFPLHRFRYYHGARLENAAPSVDYRLLDVRDRQAAIIDPKFHPESTAAKLAKEFPSGSWFDVYDYGLGDEVSFPYSVSVLRVSTDAYKIQAPIPVFAKSPPGIKFIQ